MKKWFEDDGIVGVGGGFIIIPIMIDILKIPVKVTVAQMLGIVLIAG